MAKVDYLSPFCFCKLQNIPKIRPHSDNYRRRGQIVINILDISNNLLSSSIAAQLPIFREWKIDAQYRHTFEYNYYSDGIGDRIKIGLMS